VQALRDHLTNIGKHIESQDQHIERLEGIQATLMRERDQVRNAKAQYQQKVLLGQIAYVMSSIVDHYGHGPDGSAELVPPSREFFCSKAASLDNAKRAKWEAFVER
jgi:hypothetical protein